jgi:hypothetical protein
VILYTPHITNIYLSLKNKGTYREFLLSEMEKIENCWSEHGLE